MAECRHITIKESVCTDCGACVHEVVLNRVCYYCGETEPIVTNRQDDQTLVPLASLTKRRPDESD